MKKVLGIGGLLFAICLVTALTTDRFLTAYNIENLLRRTSLLGVIAIGASFVIMSRGIDLSIGSMVGLIGCLLPMILIQHNPGWSTTVFAVLIVPMLLLLSGSFGAIHGMLIAKVRLQPFVVTLCGLLIYRGLARHLAEDSSMGFGTEYQGLRELATGRIPITEEFGLPVPTIILAVIALAAGFLLNFTVFGRYLLAIGRNEDAVRYSGIRTDRVVIAAYAICGLLSGLGGILYVLDVNSAPPASFGSFYELYAIAAAVLGGCSLRGGEGTILGVILGAAMLRVLETSINLLGISSQLEFAILGTVILAGVVADEVVKRAAARRRI